MRKSLFICIALVSFIASAHAQTATEILAKVSSVYAGCRTYSDEGLTSTTEDPQGRRSYFRTSFVRPGAFRFQLWLNSDKPGGVKPWVLWTNGDLVRIPGIPTPTGVQHLRIDTALSRMAQFSDGSSVVVPPLLFPDKIRTLQLFSMIVDARVAGEDNIDGRQSFRVEGTRAGLPIKLWIDKTQYLILKTYRKVRFGNSEIESTVQYKPKLNAEVPPEDLALPQSPNPSITDVFNSNQSVTDASNSKSLVRLPSDLARQPRLRNFGSSLSRDEQTVGGNARPSEDEDVVRVETDLVVCAVLVLDAQGKTVRGLTTEDFVVKEDGKPQEVATLSLGNDKDLPRSIVLVIDYSVSQSPFIRTSIESAKMLVDKLNPRDRMAIVTDDVNLLVDFTSDKQLLKTQLEGLKTSALSGNIGQSEQYDALLASLNELFNNEDVRPIIIFQTDGDQLEKLNKSTSREMDTYYWLPQKYSLEDIMTATEKTRAAVYSVISGIKFVDVPQNDLARRARVDWEDRRRANFDMIRARNLSTPRPNVPNPPDQFFDGYAQKWQSRQMALMRVAKFTGTIPEFLEEPSQADEIYTRVLTDIDRRYVIGYYPTNRLRDGKRRKVSIEVRNHPEYEVWGQKSYFGRKEQ
ncbi:MAG TPA: VWA domain-containing protein [Pyrinomonadaceae bacterium]|nr:VWA domain-containing protein [Pyrinomonadaceae bacterium]